MVVLSCTKRVSWGEETQKENLLPKDEQVLLKVIQESDAEGKTAKEEIKTPKTHRRNREAYLTKTDFVNSCRVTVFLILPASHTTEFRRSPNPGLSRPGIHPVLPLDSRLFRLVDTTAFRKVTDFLGFPAGDEENEWSVIHSMDGILQTEVNQHLVCKSQCAGQPSRENLTTDLSPSSCPPACVV